MTDYEIYYVFSGDTGFAGIFRNFVDSVARTSENKKCLTCRQTG